MATSSYLKSLFGGFQPDMRRVFNLMAEYLLDRNLRFGPIANQGRTENFAGVYLTSTTAGTSSAEFSILHGLGFAPNVVFQVIDPGAVNSQWVPDLKVTRAADGARLYFSSASTGLVFSVYAER